MYPSARVFRLSLLIPPRTLTPPRSLYRRPRASAPCPMNHQLKPVACAGARNHFSRLDWYKRDLTATCRKPKETKEGEGGRERDKEKEGGWKTRRASGERWVRGGKDEFRPSDFLRGRPFHLLLLLLSTRSNRVLASRITPAFYIPLSFYVSPLCRFMPLLSDARANNATVREREEERSSSSV